MFVYTRAIELVQSSLDWENDDIRAILLDNTSTAGSEEDAEFVDDISTLGEVTGTGYTRPMLANAVTALDTTNDLVRWTADSISFGALNVGYTYGLLIYLHVNDDSDSKPLLFIDNVFKVTAAAPAVTGATTVYVDPLPDVLTSGTVLAFPSAVNATLTAGAAKGARQLSVSALSGGIALAAQADSPGTGFPIPSNGGPVTIAFPANLLEIANAP